MLDGVMHHMLITRPHRRPNARSVDVVVCVGSLCQASPALTQDAVLAYVQDHGTEDMKKFASKAQRKLRSLITEAWVWNAARDNAKLEARSDQPVLLMQSTIQDA